MNRARIYAGIFLVSMCVLMLELGLTRLFSATMYYHFAFLAISLALFGPAASGIFIFFVQRRLAPERTGTWLAVASALFGVTSVFALFVILGNPLTTDIGPDNRNRLLSVYGATVLPFFFAGCAITLAIARLAHDVSRLYLYDLAGAALGCLLLIPVLNAIGAVNAVLVVAAIAALAAVLMSTATPGGRAVQVVTGVIAVVLVGLAVRNCITQSIDVRFSKGREEGHRVFSKWNSFSRITIAQDRWGGYHIKIDADAATHVVNNAAELALHKARRLSIETLAFHLVESPDVLIIGPGGGQDVANARVFGAKSITAVEVNPIIARDVMLNEPFKTYSGNVYGLPDVKLVVDEGRSFIRGQARRYDVIQGTMVDTWAATAAGAFALTENNLYTVEAFKDYANHLTDDGLLTMTRWFFQPPDQLMRLVTVARQMMAELGISHPERHIMLVVDNRKNRDRAPATFIFKKSEFTARDIRRVEMMARHREYDVLYMPGMEPPNLFTQLLVAPDPAVVWDSLPSNVAPVRDNNPFFFNSLRVANLLAVYDGAIEWQKTNLGTSVLFLLLGLTTVVVVVFMVGPLLFVHGRDLARGGSKLAHLCYFGCLGAGFIIVEIAMMQRFILFLGHPVYSLAVVLFSLLLFSAVGSALTGRFRDDRLQPLLVRVLLVLAGLVVVYILVLPPIFYGLVHLPLALRIAIAVLLMAPLAMTMGMPMPTGIRILAARTPELIPWAWGVNGATSVMGSVAALVIAILTGFDQALFVGALLYLLAIVFVRRTRAASAV